MDLDYARLQASALMMTAYKDFVDLAAKYRLDRGAGGNDFTMAPPIGGQSPYATDELTDGLASIFEADEVYESPGECEFPVPDFFSLAEVDPEDPSFYTGRRMGLPVSVAVNPGGGQNRLLPIMSKKFYNNGL